MKVLQINTVCGTGSTGRIAVDIHNKLIDHGHESVIAYGRGTHPNGVSTIKIGNNVDLYLHGMYTRLADKHGFASAQATKNFISQIKHLMPDIIHLHNIHGYYLNIKVLFGFLKEYKRPVFWTLHDCWTYTGHCAYYDYAGCNKWKYQCSACPQKRNYPASFFLDNSRSNFIRKKELFTSIEDMTIIVPSKWLAHEVNQSFLKKYPIYVIHNGIDLTIFKPDELKDNLQSESDKKFSVLGVASIWEERKGLDYFIELSKRLSNEFQITLLGLNDKQIKQLPASIVGIKRTHNAQDLVRLYSSADIFANFTLEDNFPTTNIEALACGTPVLTFNSGGSTECIDETCGFVVEKGDLQAAIDVINKVKNGQDMSKACIKRAQNFRNHDKFQEYIDLYKQKMEELKSRY